ncbi:alpha/beta fold hydrolase [Streptomyces sp. NPDC048172]|uniref:alpha/beta fold hydrolase n=1 Tax=Streptomyces sp. NPDC048172 TaxID=3365505 RepID=UPI0037153764
MRPLSDRPSSPGKRFARLAYSRMAYVDEGAGPPVLLLHGCPFSSSVWRGVSARLAGRYRCLAPDLLGAGDTETHPRGDWRLPEQARAVRGLLDALGVERAAVVGHGHGGAVAQLIALRYPERVSALVLAGSQAYDNWPSTIERPFFHFAQQPMVGRMMTWNWSRRPLFRQWLVNHHLVHDTRALTPGLVDGCVRDNLTGWRRRARTRRLMGAQLNRANQAHTRTAAGELSALTLPTLLLWGEEDAHYPPRWGERLRADIPGAVRLELVPGAGHLLMAERPDHVASALDAFLGAHGADGGTR